MSECECVCNLILRQIYPCIQGELNDQGMVHVVETLACGSGMLNLMGDGEGYVVWRALDRPQMRSADGM